MIEKAKIAEGEVIDVDKDGGMVEISEVDNDKKGEVPNGTHPGYFSKNVNLYLPICASNSDACVNICYDEMLTGSYERYSQSQNSSIDVRRRLSAVSCEKGYHGVSMDNSVEKPSHKTESWQEIGMVSYEGMSLDHAAGNEELWIGDTGASAHITHSSKGMINLIKPKSKVEVVMGNGEKIERELTGNVKGHILDKNGKKVKKVQIENVIVSTEAEFNLFSITSMIRKGWELKGSNEMLEITKGKQSVKFDIKIKTPRGMLFLIAIKRSETNTEIGMNGITMWAKTDKDAETFKINSGNAPEWNRVYRRKTISLKDNKVIEDIHIFGELAKSFLTRKFPNNIKGI